MVNYTDSQTHYFHSPLPPRVVINDGRLAGARRLVFRNYADDSPAGEVLLPDELL